MLSKFKGFIMEEDGLGTVEIVIIIAILVGLALLFRKQIYKLVNDIFGQITDKTGGLTESPDN